MKKNIFSVLTLLALASGALVGCGGSKGSSVHSSASYSLPGSSEPSLSSQPSTLPSSNPASSSEKSSSNPNSSRPSIYDPDDPSNITSGNITGVKKFKDALEFDYSNCFIYYGQSYNDGSISEYAYEYVVDGITTVLDYTYVETYGVMDYDYYCSTEEDDYVWWKKKDGYVYDGWIAEGYRGSDLAMYHAYFDLNRLLSGLTEDDVEEILGFYYVKTTSMRALQEHGLEFFGDPFMGTEVIQDVGFSIDEETGQILRIVGSVSDKSDSGFDIRINQVGETVLPKEAQPLPKKPYRNSDTDRNIYTYPEMNGDDYVPDVYPTSVSLSIVGEHESDADADIVLDLDESVELSYAVLPENTNVFWYDVWKASDNTIVDFDYKANNTTHHRYVTGIKTGTTKIWVVQKNESGEFIKSNELTVKVNGVKPQNKENAVYDLVLTGSEFAYSMDGENKVYNKNITNFTTYNNIDTTAEVSLTGHNAKCVEARYTDCFGQDGYVLQVDPASQEYMHDGNFYSSFAFDFGDQEVTSISFYYSLFKANQKGASLDNLAEAYMETSLDGTNWTKVDIKAEMQNNFKNYNLDYDVNLKLMEKSFSKARQVRFYFKASMVGKNYQIVMNNFVFCADSTCHNHGEPTGVPVTSVQISSMATSVKVNNSLQFALVSVLPNDATNKKVTWTVSDTNKATIDNTGLLKAKAEGTVEVYAVAHNGVESNKITVTIVGADRLADNLVNRIYFIDDEIVNSTFYDVKLIVTSTSAVDLIYINQNTKAETTFTFQVEEKNEDTNPTYTFSGEEANYVLRAKFSESSADVYFRGPNGYSLGGTTSTPAELHRYVPSTSISIRSSNTEVTTLSLIAGSNATIYVEAKAGSNTPSVKKCSVTSLTPSVATVASQGESGTQYVVNAIAAGTAQIKCVSADGVEKVLTVTVTAQIKAESITITSPKTKINVGESIDLTAVINPSTFNAINLSWSAGTNNVASATKKNELTATVKGLKAGTATITVTDSISGKSASIDLVVESSGAVIVPSTFIGTWSGYDTLSSEITVTVTSTGLTLDIDGETYSFTAAAPIKGWGNSVEFTYDEDASFRVVLRNPSDSVEFYLLENGNYYDGNGIFGEVMYYDEYVYLDAQ